MSEFEDALEKWLLEASSTGQTVPTQLLSVVSSDVADTSAAATSDEDALTAAQKAVLGHLELTSVPDEILTGSSSNLWAVAQLALYCCIESESKERHVEIILSLDQTAQGCLMQAITTVSAIVSPYEGSEGGSPAPHGSEAGSLTPDIVRTPITPLLLSAGSGAGAGHRLDLSMLSGPGRTPVEDKSRKVLERENRLLREEVMETKSQMRRMASEMKDLRAASANASSSSSGGEAGSHAANARRTVIQAELEYVKEREEREAEVQAELAGKDTTIAELKAKLGRLEKESHDVEALRDELDVLRPLRAVAAKSEMLSSKYKAQQETLADLQSQMSDLRDQSQSLVENNTRLQRDADRLPTLKKQVEQYRTAKCDAEVRVSELEMTVAGHLADLTTVKADLSAAREQIRQAQLASTLEAEGMGGVVLGGSGGLGGGMSEFNPEVMEKMARLEAENALLKDAAAGQSSEAVQDLQNQLDDITRMKIVMEKQWAEEKRGRAEAVLRAETAEAGWDGEKSTAAQVQAQLKVRMDKAEAGWEATKASFQEEKADWEATKAALDKDIADLQAANASLEATIQRLRAAANEADIRAKQDIERLKAEMATKDRAAAATLEKLTTLEGSYLGKLQEMTDKLKVEKRRRMEAEAKAEIRKSSWQREMQELRDQLAAAKKSQQSGASLTRDGETMIKRLQNNVKTLNDDKARLEKKLKAAEAVAAAAKTKATRAFGSSASSSSSRVLRSASSSRFGSAAATGAGDGDEAYVESMKRLQDQIDKAQKGEQTAVMMHADEIRKRKDLQADCEQLKDQVRELETELTRVKLDVLRGGGSTKSIAKSSESTSGARMPSSVDSSLSSSSSSAAAAAPAEKKASSSRIAVTVDSNNPGKAKKKTSGSRAASKPAPASADDSEFDTEFSSGPPPALQSNTALLNGATAPSCNKLTQARASVITARRRPSVYSQQRLPRQSRRKDKSAGIGLE